MCRLESEPIWNVSLHFAHAQILVYVFEGQSAGLQLCFYGDSCEEI